MAHGEIQNRVLQLVYSVLGGTIENTPAWLIRPGVDQCRDQWPTICVIYRSLTGRELPQSMPPRESRRVDCVLKTGNSVPRIIEVDEKQHFNCYRAETLALYPEIPVAFDRQLWIQRSKLKFRLEGGGFGRPKPPLFPNQGGRHLQRAFRDALCDILPISYGFLPTLRIADFEVADWITASDGRERMKKLLDQKFSSEN